MWCEYGFVAGAIHDDRLVGGLCSFDTKIVDLNFFHKIFVLQTFRNAAIGSALLTAYVEYLDLMKKRSIFTTSPTNDAMRKLTVKLGFRIVGFSPAHYGPEKDRILMGRGPMGELPTHDQRWFDDPDIQERDPLPDVN